LATSSPPVPSARRTSIQKQNQTEICTVVLELFFAVLVA
jgi:hypothetical protein